VIGLLELLAALALLVPLAQQGDQPVPTPAQLEEEVIENVRRQPLGDGTVEDLALPADFVRRVADRIVRASYEERYRIVVRDAEGPVARDRKSPWLAISVAVLAVACLVWIVVARRREASAR
jgi:hypothetical protein